MSKSERALALCMTVLAVAFLLAAPFLSILSTGASFGFQRALTNDNVDQDRIRIASIGTGTTAHVYLVYEDTTVAGPTSQHIFFRRSTNGGQTFDAPFDFLSSWTSTSQRQRWPTIAVHEGVSTTTIAVAYIDNTPDPLFLDYTVTCRISTDNGVTWSSGYTVVPEVRNNYREVQLAFDPNGNLFCLYTFGPIGASTYYVVYSTNFGQTWSSSNQVPIPEGPEVSYKMATLAADGSYLGIAYLGYEDWQEKIFFVRASTSSLGGGSLTWGTPKHINFVYGEEPEGWLPVLTAHKDVFHLAWWDFETDASRSYEAENSLTKDRPCIKYTRSTDHGNSFSVGTKPYVKVNESLPTPTWISAPSMSTNPSGLIAITFTEVIKGVANIYLTTSSDGGVTWSKRTRVNSYYPDHDISSRYDGRDGTTKDNPVITFHVAVDGSTGIYCSWLDRPSPSEDREVMFTNTIANLPPIAITDVKLISYDETWGDVRWSINREPDFMEYRTHISTTSGFTPDHVPFPAGTLYNKSKNQGMNYELFRNLEPDAYYYVKVEVVDDQNVTSASNEVSFKTNRVNVAPIFNRALVDLVIEMEEDGRLDKAINLSDWIDYTPYSFETRYEFQPGKYIKDDWYNNVTDLEFELECEEDPESSIVLGNIEEEWLGKTYYYIDFNSNPNFKDQFGDVRFRLKVTDAGKDGSLQTVKDNKANTSYWFTVRVLSTNDLPEWKSFTDLMIGTGKVTDMNKVKDILILDDLNTSCIEEQAYSFKINCIDVDGDFVKLEVQQGDPMRDRISVKRDTVDPRRAAVFTFTPQDSDLPLVRFNITADDEMGGILNLTLVIPVKNINDEPYFLTVDGNEVAPKGDTVVFEVDERSTLTFDVTGWDIDPNELLTLTASPSTVIVTKTGAGSWTVSYKVPDYRTGTTTLNLLLRDRQGSFADLTVTVKIKDVPEPPRPPEAGNMIVMRVLYDATDTNEWGQPGGRFIRPEFGEPIEFEGFAVDPDGDVLNFTWRFSNEKETVNWTHYGKKVSISFYPTQSTLSYAKREKYRVNLTVSDGYFGAIYGYMETWVEPDDDNDNDGIPDNRELWFYNLIVDPESGRPGKPEAWMDPKIKDDSAWQKFADQVVQNYRDQQVLLTDEVKAEPLLLFNPEDDLDRDRTEDNTKYPNSEEIGFKVPQQESEKERVPRINTYNMDPLDPLVWPGHPRKDPEVPPDAIEDDDIELWVIVAGSVILLILLAAVLTVVIILRREKAIEKREDEDLEKRVKDHEKRQAVIQGMYGVQKAGDAIGPDQSTLDDLSLDMGGKVYHEEGSHTLTIKRKDEDPTGPQRQKSDSGPLFEKSAPKLELSEALKLETIDIGDDVTQLDHSGVDEEALGASMDDLMDAAEEFDPNAVKNAGGNVLVGAVPMEEQMRLRQQGAQVGGPRLPPPGQEGVPMAPPPRPYMPGAPPMPQQMPPKRPPQ